jgi:uncharacterized membrane protein
MVVVVGTQLMTARRDRGTGPVPPAAPHPPTSCSVSRLPLLAGHRSSLVSGASRTGNYLVGATSPDEDIFLEGDIGGPGADRHPVVWHDGAVTEVAMSGTWRALTDINSAGVAVGVTSEVWTGNQLRSTAWVYRNGVLSKLPGTDGLASAGATAINDSGTIVGYRADAPLKPEPLVWPTPTSPPTELRLPGPGWTGTAYDIDTDGTIVGTVERADGTSQAYVWHADQTGYALATPQFDGVPADQVQARAIAGDWVLGSASETASSANGVVVWNLRTGQLRMPSFAASGLWVSLNPHGWLVGNTNDRRPAYAWDDSVIALPEPERGQDLGRGVAVSDDGTIVAGYLSSQPSAAIWRCR